MFLNCLLKSNGNFEYCKRERERERIPGGREREREMKRKETIVTPITSQTMQLIIGQTKGVVLLN